MFEYPDLTKPYNIRFQVTYPGEKVPGTIGRLYFQGLQVGLAEFTPLHGIGHWSVTFPGLSDEEGRDQLRDFAREWVKSGSYPR